LSPDEHRLFEERLNENSRLPPTVLRGSGPERERFSPHWRGFYRYSRFIASFVLGTGPAVPDVSADGRRILFTGRINFQNQNPGNWMQVMVIDDFAGGGLKHVTDITEGAAWGGTMTDDGRDIWLLTNAPWKGKTGLHKVRVAPLPN
jgi:hypothetical protein